MRENEKKGRKREKEDIGKEKGRKKRKEKGKRREKRKERGMKTILTGM